MTPRPPPHRQVIDAVAQSEVQEALRATKFIPSRIRPGTSIRPALIDRLVSGAAYPLVVISAPVGFGKATLLASWAEKDPRPFAWVSLDRTDDDPVALLGSIVRAIDPFRTVDPALFAALATPGISTLGQLVPGVLRALQSPGVPFVLVLHNLHEVHRAETRDTLGLLVDHLPPAVQIAVSSRQSVWLADARRRGRGDLLELGLADLSFDEDEAAQLLASAGVTLSADDLRELVRSTGGWAAGLYLSALALRSGRLDPARRADASGHPFISQYLRSEVLSQMTPQALRFVRRTSILDVMSGALCDSVLETTGSAQRLESLAQTNFFLQPLDDRHEWFRYHTLFRATLLDDLVHRDPDIIPSLHLRAADWWRVNGSVDQAVRHAQAGGHPARAGQLVATHITPAYLAGQLPAIERWIKDLGETVIERDPTLAVLVGWMAALGGRPIEATRWCDLVEHADPADIPGRDMAWFQSLRAMLRAALCAHGVAAMKTDAELAVSLMPEWDVWRSVGVGLLATAHWLQGDDARADLLYGDAIENADATGGNVPHARLLGQRAIVRIDRGDWAGAAQDVDDARAIVNAAGLTEYGASAIVYAAAARLDIHRHDRAAAAAMLHHALRLRVLTTWSLPWSGVLLRVELADTQLALADADGAGVLLREIDEILHHRPSLGVLNDRVERLRALLKTANSGQRGSTLTAAELRILPYLQTHLSLKEIGERLYISRSTVNTEVRSIYRKLDVSSRSEAVSKAREVGLLAPQ